MPWTIEDVDKHKKGLSDKEKEQWVTVANSVLDKCLKDGGTDAVCAVDAIKQANGATEKKSVDILDKEIRTISNEDSEIRLLPNSRNIESFQLGFMTDTVSPWDNMIESEFNRKIYRPSKQRVKRLSLDLTELSKANLDSTANYLTKLVGTGLLTINEGRLRCGESRIEGGDKAYVPMNWIDINAPITQNKKVDKNITIDENGKGNQDNIK